VVAREAVSEAHSSPAIVLRWRPYGESDKIVTFLSRDFGKFTGIAKGAARSKRRFVNSLEPLARVRIHFRQRPQASLAFLESSELLVPSGALSDPIRFAYGSYLAELVDRLTAEGQPAADLHALLAEALAELEKGPATAAFLRSFELKLLARVGVGPELEHCAGCERPFETAATAVLDPARGTFLCPACRHRARAPADVEPTLRSLLADLGLRPLADCRSRALGTLASDAAELTGKLIALHLDRPLRSVKLIHQLAADARA
jgi:DNA repair protein RecO (recombination protein O)